MRATIAVLPGDGIGPEVVAQATRVLECVAELWSHQFQLKEALLGGCAIDAVGTPLPEDTVELCERADAVLLGAVGGPKWDDTRKNVRPEQGLLGLRKRLGLFANLRPVRPFPALLGMAPIKPEIVRDVNLLIVRELTGGIYFGEKKRDEWSARDVCTYSVDEIERVVRVGCEIARGRRKKVTSVDKANVLETSRLWRDVTTRVAAEEFPDITLDHVLVDACAMHLINRPASFDVLVMENMFGDILSDEAAMLVGSIGMIPSASLGEGRRGLYEPIHGSAPDIAGKGIANPYATILSAAMLLRHSLGLTAEASAVEASVHTAIERGIWTADIGRRCTTREVGSVVVEELRRARG